MTLPMIIALAVTVLMIILIMVDKLPFGAPPLLALLLLVVFGVTDIKTAFGGFANPTIVMLASFMAIIAALQKTSFIVKFKQTMFNMASKGGFKAYVLLILMPLSGAVAWFAGVEAAGDAHELMQTIKSNVTVDWVHRDSARANIRRLVKRLLRKYGYPPDLQDAAVQNVLQQAEALSAEWAA